ncbi:hypothetical protein D3C78_1169290 [compost metagenome]
MLIPTCDSTIMMVMVLITIASTLRNSVNKVRSRALGRIPLLSSNARRCSIILAISVQLNTAITTISRICTSPPMIFSPFSLPAHWYKLIRCQASNSSSVTANTTITRSIFNPLGI